MQLTVDPGAPVDIEFKMTTIKEVIFNEIITNNADQAFTEDVKNSGDIVKDVTSEYNEELKKTHLNESISENHALASIMEREELEKSISESKSPTPTVKVNEQNVPENIVNNDKPISHESEFEIKLSNDNVEEKVNVANTHISEEQKSKAIVPKNEEKVHINGDENINIIVPEDATEDSKTDVVKENEVIEKNNAEETIDDEMNMDIERSIPDNVDQVPNTTDEKEEQSPEITESQSEDMASPVSAEIDDDENKAIESESVADSISANLPNANNSGKEREITGESVISVESETKSSTIEIEDEKINEINKHSNKDNNVDMESKVEEIKEATLISKLTNILDLLSDDDEERPADIVNNETSNVEKCISLVDDDDVMLIDEDTSVNEDANNTIDTDSQNDKVVAEACVESASPNQRQVDEVLDTKNTSESEEVINNLEVNELDTKTNDREENSASKPLLSLNFLSTCKKTLADMTREDLEDFCSLKIVESIMDRSNLGDLKTQLKTMAVTIEEFKKKTNLLSKQNRDLQVVLKSIQEEQKKSLGTALTPLKITRSVGMQVLMTDKPNAKRKNTQILNSSATSTQPLPLDKTNRNPSVSKVQKTKNQPIPVPRLVPAANTGNKMSPAVASNTADPGKSPQMPPLVNGVRSSPPALKPEKRSRVQSVTVDLTDDEPPLKVTAKSSPASGVRLVPAQNLLPPQRPQFAPTMTSPRKVYIPISGPQAQNVKPGQTVVLKTVPPSPGLRPRIPGNSNVNKVQPNTIRMNRPAPPGRHPAPLPDAVKQYQPTSWKALPPAPDLKLSKVDNGIVISWKIDGYQEDSYEEITSYQLFAYQETNCPPSTALWKKIGDVKALPLPMACTLTQFLAGYKYYFAVRAVDIKSRFGPFSLPASILLLNKM